MLTLIWVSILMLMLILFMLTLIWVLMLLYVLNVMLHSTLILRLMLTSILMLMLVWSSCRCCFDVEVVLQIDVGFNGGFGLVFRFGF